MAKLSIKHGVMGSNKTAELIITAHKYEEGKMKPLVLKPKIDTKGDDYIVSRVGLKRKVDYLIDTNDDLKKLDLSDVDIILVDECQFLSIDQAKDLYKIAVLKDIPVICYGLKTDFLNKPFPTMSYLMAMAHSIYELKTICSCGKKATCNVRFVNDKAVFSGNTIVIDDDAKVSYKAVCAECYYRLKNKA